MVPELDLLRESPVVGAPRYEHAKLGFVALGYAAAGQFEQARALLPRLDSLSRSGHTFPIEDDVRAMLSLADGDPEGSLAHVHRSQARDYGIERVLQRLIVGDANAELGRWDAAAAAYLVNWRDADLWAQLLPLAHERLGETYLALADTARAVEHLTAFAEMWKEADPGLQPRVDAARERAADLAAP